MGLVEKGHIKEREICMAAPPDWIPASAGMTGRGNDGPASIMSLPYPYVIPAKAGIHGEAGEMGLVEKGHIKKREICMAAPPDWIPAFAGMTGRGNDGPASIMSLSYPYVIPAKAGIHGEAGEMDLVEKGHIKEPEICMAAPPDWIPAFAGMTGGFF